MTALLELAERCEKATGPSDKLDGEIHQMLTGKEPFKGGRWSDTPYYTASLDAAMTLVPEGFGWSLGSNNCAVVHKAEAAAFSPGDLVGNGAATPTLALCAAALRARSA